METYFQIRYEFDPAAVRRRLGDAVQQRRPGYICVADGNVLAGVHRDAGYRNTVAGSLFSVCDSSWVPLYLRWLYGIRRSAYCGARLFRDIVQGGGYRMAFLGGSAEALHKLRSRLAAWNPEVAHMPFIELPYCAAEEFDYPAIASRLAGADIIWVGLGAPKQERFMERMLPHLESGVMIGVGAVFNFYSGCIRRAPSWLRALRLEFVWRLLAEPRKQISRCMRIASTLPAILAAESRRKLHIGT